MLTIPENKEVFVYTEAVDMRKAINGLIVILLETYSQDPQSGDLYIFTNKRRDKVKCLLWDNNGFALYYKRLEKGRFNYSKHMVGDKIIVTKEQFQALMMGLDFYLLTQIPEEKYQDLF